jgi:amidase
MKKGLIFVALCVVALGMSRAPVELSWDDLGTLRARMDAGGTSSIGETVKVLERIQKFDDRGPAVNSVIAINPRAGADARNRDAQRQAGNTGPLHGLPILIKDNIETLDPMPTTAGSLALARNDTRRDAPLVARLRAAGMVVIGKSNLSEWANIRSGESTSGWSAVGGLTRNPHDLARNSCGSSSGSGTAVAAGIVPAAIGTETDGSITCPASVNGIVGFKPSVGLVSRTHIVPISASQDTAGPMTLSVRDAALLMNAIAGSDPADPATAEADARKVDYVAGLSPNGLRGLRIGVVSLPGTNEMLLKQALMRMEAAGAVIVPINPDLRPIQEAGEDEFLVLLTELKVQMGEYLTTLPRRSRVRVRSLADVIAFNIANADRELQYFGQETFVLAEATKGLDDPAYLAARANSLRAAGAEGIDRWLSADRLDLIVAQTNGTAWVSTLGKGDDFAPPSASRPPAIAGYPHLTVPMGGVDGLPVGLSFIGPKWSDALVLRAGHAFEVAGPPLRLQPTFRNGAQAG